MQIQKGILSELIKKLQTNYFKDKKISETEYKVKLEAFKEMIRDLDRKIPLLREKLIKIGRRPSQQKALQRRINRTATF